jgi:TRAP-type C4-dicarboxylate transport system permease small subunit
MDRIDRAIGGLARLLRWAGQIVLVFMMASICYDTLMRYVFVAPTRWSQEVNTFLLVFLGLAPAASVLRTGNQLHIGFFRMRFGRRQRLSANAIIAVLGIVFCAVMTWRGGIMAWHAFHYGERMSTTLGTPMVLPFALIPIGFGLLTLQFLLDLVAALGGQERAEEAVGEVL